MTSSSPTDCSHTSVLVDEARAIQTLKQTLQSSQLSQLVELISAHGELYLVGGIVRDAFLDRSLKDIDLATSLSPQEVESIVKREDFRVIETGIEHGTITILADGSPIEVTTFRKPSARTATEFGASIEEDLSGRDFTLNAIAFDLKQEILIDPFHGVDDLKAGVLRAVGNAHERFQEDPLRLLRMIRFGAAAGRETLTETLDAACKVAEGLSRVSVERIREEFLAILMSPFPHKGVQALHETGLLPYVIPELLPSVGCEQNEWHIHDVFEHTLWVLERSVDDRLVRVAALLHDIGKPGTLSIGDDGRRHFYKHESLGAKIGKEFLERLRFSKADTKAITLLVQQHMRPLDCGESGVRRVMRDLGEQFERWLLLKRADAPPVMPEDEFEAMYERFLQMVQREHERAEGPAYGKLAIGGQDLLAMGIPKGPEIGALLKQCEEVVIEDPEKNTREDLLEVVASGRSSNESV